MEISKLETNISSSDPKRLTEFYRDVVGVPFNTEFELFIISESAVFIIDFHSEVEGQAQEPARILINFVVADLPAEEARMKAAGVTFIRSQAKEGWGGMFSTFLDPDGNYVQLEQMPEGM